jgi:hypothetical protein
MCALSDGSSKSSVVLDRELDQEKSLDDPSGPRIRCPLCGGRPARAAGLVPAATSGTRSTWADCVPPASINGLRLSAYLVAAGRRIRSGIRSHEVQSPCVKVHSRSVNEELKIASGL